jgi:hypothetical protein
MTFREKLDRYFELTGLFVGLKKLAVQWWLHTLQKEGFRVPEKEEVDAILERHPMGPLKESIYVLFEEHFSEGELDALLEFEGSPIGQRIRVTRSEMEGRMADAAKKWAYEIMRDFMDNSEKGS